MRITRIKDRDNPSNPSNPWQVSGSDDLWALCDVFFEACPECNRRVKRGEVDGVIGRNGAGKSTLVSTGLNTRLKILSRITEPTSGRAEIHGRVGSLLEVGTGFHPELTGRENIFLNGATLGVGMKRVETCAEFVEASPASSTRLVLSATEVSSPSPRLVLSLPKDAGGGGCRVSDGVSGEDEGCGNERRCGSMSDQEGSLPAITERDLHAHLQARMAQRGVTLEEIQQALQSGWQASDCRPGTQGQVWVFSYGAEWEGRFYDEKEVTVYYKVKDGLRILLTVMARYGERFVRGGIDED